MRIAHIVGNPKKGSRKGAGMFRKVFNFFKSFVNNEFVTVVGCMDGRAIHALYWYFRLGYGVRFTDMITRPGVVGIVWNIEKFKKLFIEILERVAVSMLKHRSRLVAIVGHSDCAGNKVSDVKQKMQTIELAQKVQECLPEGTKVLALWVGMDNENPKPPEVLWRGKGLIISTSYSAIDETIKLVVV